MQQPLVGPGRGRYTERSITVQTKVKSLEIPVTKSANFGRFWFLFFLLNLISGSVVAENLDICELSGPLFKRSAVKTVGLRKTNGWSFALSSSE